MAAVGHPLFIDASSRENLVNIRLNLISPETSVSGEHFCRRQYGRIFIRFHTVVSENEAGKFSQTDNEKRF